MNAIAAYFVADALLGRPADATRRSAGKSRPTTSGGTSTGLRDRLRALLGGPVARPASAASSSSAMRFVRASSEWRETVGTYLSSPSAG